jgi:hypothetical protein
MVSQISTGTIINNRSTMGTTTAAMTIATNVSIILSISITSACLEPTGQARCGTGASRPRERARSMASRRRWAPSLSYRCRMCVRTVFTDT